VHPGLGILVSWDLFLREAAESADFERSSCFGDDVHVGVNVTFVDVFCRDRGLESFLCSMELYW